MSPTPTASRPAADARARKAWAPRWLVILHRYVGVAVGALMLLWCLSGVVMLFVHYPQVGRDDRLARLPPIDWSRCCTFGGSVEASTPVAAAAIEDLAGAPVLRLRLAGGERRVIDLATGSPLQQVSAGTAVAVARTFAGDPVARGVAMPVERDQWTVTGYFNKARPFWRVRLDDGQGTDVYVARASGEVAQRTTASARVLNWLGAIPHWLYPAVLRQDVKLWSQVVIWTSIVGTFLTLTGLYLGVVAWRPFRDRRLSPFRGLMTWHHLVGLATGALTLTWVVSGLVSMNPWGFLESPDDPALARIAGAPPAFGQVEAALAAVTERRPTAAQVRLAPFQGGVFVVAGGRRYDAQGRLAPLTPDDLARAGASLGQVSGRLPARGLMRTEDAYYFAHHEPVTLAGLAGDRPRRDPRLPGPHERRHPLGRRSRGAGLPLAAPGSASPRRHPGLQSRLGAGASPWCCCSRASPSASARGCGWPGAGGRRPRPAFSQLPKIRTSVMRTPSLLASAAVLALAAGAAQPPRTPPPRRARSPRSWSPPPPSTSWARPRPRPKARSPSRSCCCAPSIASASCWRPCPGLVVTTHSGEGKANQYLLRGFNLDHGTDLATWVGGMPVNQRTHAHGSGYTDLNFLIPELASGIHFTKGPYYASEGDFSAVGSNHLGFVESLPTQVAVSAGTLDDQRLFAGGTVDLGNDRRLILAGEDVHLDGPWDHPDDLRKVNLAARYAQGEPDNGVAVTALYYRGKWNATTDQPRRAVEQGLIGRFGTLDPSTAARPNASASRWRRPGRTSALAGSAPRPMRSATS